ncbi:deoxyribonuclease [Helicobacter aurati]|uniref:Deoxyribonuclease n=1 Tax=Helicobacter aurati TaxID=137778 RepID=A0A3D8IWV5_9HELI|nr:endonuclease [Helicobacter aurati]RDU69767.1 deoxyribonuclease [Helicobacter aurati]
MARKLPRTIGLTKKKLLFSSPILFALAILVVFANSPSPQTFSESKELLSKAWNRHNFTRDFYCQAPFTITESAITVIPSEYYTPRKPLASNNKPNIRASRIEFEHIMPAHNFGKHLPCWKKGGRKACKEDKTFNSMEADLYNLVPAIGEINADRSNYKYAEAPRNVVIGGQYGNCPVHTDFKAKRFYPADYSKGLIARTYLYMSNTYNIRLSDSELKLMQAWDKMYPPNDYEIQRNKIIEEIMFWQRINALRKIF